MTANDVQALIKASVFFEMPKESFNKAVWACSQQILSAMNKEKQEAVKAEKEASRYALKQEKAKHKKAMQEAKSKPTDESISEKMQHFMDNPMSEEDEAKALRALLHVGLSTGEISPQLLDKLDKIVGVSTGKDEVVELVDFSKAFPDMATALEICTKPRPEGI